MNKILVVEDEPSIRKLLAKTLELENYETLSASDGHEAIGILKADNASYGLFISDVNYHGRQEFAAYVKDQYPDVPVLAMTADIEKNRWIGKNELGAVAVLSKPFAMEDFTGAVRKYYVPQ